MMNSIHNNCRDIGKTERGLDRLMRRVNGQLRAQVEVINAQAGAIDELTNTINELKESKRSDKQKTHECLSQMLSLIMEPDRNAAMAAAHEVSIMVSVYLASHSQIATCSDLC